MSRPVPQSEGDNRSAMIVQLPESWRQTIQQIFQPESLSARIVFDEQSARSGISRPRWSDLQAEQALTLAADAAHRTGATGKAIVCAESRDGVGITLAIHNDERTELRCWERSGTTEVVEWLRNFSKNEEDDPERRSEKPASQFVIERSDLVDNLAASPPLWTLTGEGRFIWNQTSGARGILSGSFNPLHVGHRKMRAAAQELLGQPVVYEMTLQNADKPPLDWLTLALRSRQFSAGELLLTCVPTFGEKADLLPGTTFVIGWDTAVRVLERRFYPDGELESSFEMIAERECRFLIAARRDEHRLRTLDELTIPARFRDLFSAIPPELFEEEISSTAIRKAWLRGESETGPPSLFSTGMIDS